jgi:uncharacterized glyoxalase superfamily protein PhnB
MNETYIPEGYARVTPFLTVDGANKLLDFLILVFDAQIMDKTERSDGKLAHAMVRIGDSSIELAEATDQFGAMEGAVDIFVPNVDETHQRAIQNGGQELHGPMEMDYGERASAIKDMAGNHWYIATHQRS